MAAALKELSRVGYAVYPEDVARLSPLIYRHLNFQGRHAFVLPEAVAQGQLRPLRDPRQELSQGLNSFLLHYYSNATTDPTEPHPNQPEECPCQLYLVFSP